MRLLPIALLSLACSNVESSAAAVQAHLWAEALELRVLAVHCKPTTCSVHGCHCDVRLKDGIVPLECSRVACEVRLR